MFLPLLSEVIRNRKFLLWEIPCGGSTTSVYNVYNVKVTHINVYWTVSLDTVDMYMLREYLDDFRVNLS